MNTRYSLPPPRNLPPRRLEARKRHLLSQIATEPTPRLPLVRGAWKPSRLATSAVAVAAATVALLLIAPWQSGPGLVGHALAAIGDGPVLHVLTEQPGSDGSGQLLSVSTGQPVPVALQQEVWFDQGRDLKKTISRVNGAAVDQLLETRDGGFTSEGRVYTCAWIARHPVEATRAGVSCSGDMHNGTTPRDVPEPEPTLDLALSGFVDHYRAALASGQAQETGTGQLDGHDVIWLRIATSDSTAMGLPVYEEVAIDSVTYRPLLVRTLGATPVEFRVLSIDTEAYDPSLFTRPAPVVSPSVGEVASVTQIDAAAAPRVLDNKALWLGEQWQNFHLVGVEREELTTGYGQVSGRSPQRSWGVAFRYARKQSDGAEASLTIREATQCELAYAWTCTARDPRGDTMLVCSFGSILRRDGLYVSIIEVSDTPSVIEIVHALQPLARR
jgi:hypothetical protein